MTIILLIFGIGLGIGGTYLILRPKLKFTKLQAEDLDKEISFKEIRLAELDAYNLEAEQHLADIENTCNKKETESEILDQKITHLTQLCQQADKNYQDKVNFAREKIEKAKEELKADLEDARADFYNEYSSVMKDAALALSNSMHNELVKINDAKIELQKYRTLAAAAQEDLKREEKKRTQSEFFRLQIPQQDLEDINKLRELSEKLNNKEVLNKLIWKTYFEKPTNDLIGRQISKPTTGIYKIQDIESGRIYIGQCVSLADRWKQHIKRGLHAETPLNNKLYPALWEKGVENFSFELIEECARTDLNEREKFWIEYFDSKNWGYNATGGNG